MGYAATVLARKNLWAYWRLGEAVGSFQAAKAGGAAPAPYQLDSGGTFGSYTFGVTGALTGETPADNDTAVRFAGAVNNPAVLYRNDPVLGMQSAGRHKIELYVKREDLYAGAGIGGLLPGEGTILHCGHIHDTAVGIDGYELYVKNGDLIWRCTDAGGTDRILTATAPAIGTYFLVTVERVDGGTQTLSIDGVVEDSGPAGLGRVKTLSPGLAEDFTLGGIAMSFEGTIDEVSFYVWACDAAIHAIPDLVAHWSMEESSGADVVDDEGGHGGTITGAAYARGALKVHCTGSASLELNAGGVDAVNTTRVEVPHDAALNVADFTVVAWIRPQHTSGVDGILTKHAAGDVFNGYYFGKTGFGFLYVSRGDGAVDTLSYTGQQLTGGADWFVAGGADATTIKLWLNGQPVASAAAAQTTDTTNTDPLYVGYDIAAHPALGYFGGAVDDVALYSRLLTDDEILSLYNACRCGGRQRSRSYLLA